MVAVSAILCTIVSTCLFSSVFTQMDSQQYFSLVDNSNSTNAVHTEENPPGELRGTIEEGGS